MLSYKLFTQEMVRLSSFFNKSDISDLFIADYYKAVKELSNKQFQRAVDYLIKSHSSHFFPVPAEVFKAVEETREQISVTPMDKRIEPNYVNCPPEVKEMMEKTMEKIKNRGMK